MLPLNVKAWSDLARGRAENSVPVLDEARNKKPRASKATAATAALAVRVFRPMLQDRRLIRATLMGSARRRK